MKATALLFGVALALPLAAQTVPAPATVPAKKPAATDDEKKEAKKEDAITLTAFTVSDDKDVGYESLQTTSGMRTVQELKNVANSISIMNQQFIEDLGLTSMEEMATWFVSGESNPDPNATVQSRVILRGVANAYALRNGWIWYSPMDAYSTERVEELRGPNAFLYGEADVGGAQNQVTKRGLMRDLTHVKAMVGSWRFTRGEVDVNRVLVPKKLAVRFSAVDHYSGSWIDNVRRDFRGVYGAITYRPWSNTAVSVMMEHDKTTSVLPQGLFTDAYSRTQTSTLGAVGYIFNRATGVGYRAQGRVISTGPGVGVTNTDIVPKSLESLGPNATYKNYTDSFTIEAEHHIGKNLHLQLTGNWYQQQLDNWGVSARAITRDRSPLLPNGQPNPYFNELYTEYFRTRNLNGNIVRDIRFSAVYDFVPFKWLKEQFIFNVQQHQDNPGQKKPKYGEYLDFSNPNWIGTLNPAITQAAFTANRTVFTNNRFTRRYYLRDGVRRDLTNDLGPIPGVSAWYPDLSNQVAAAGQFIDRRFYTPSWGVGASGTYLEDHLFTMVGYRQDKFNMKTTRGMVRAQKDWVVDYLDVFNTPALQFVRYKVDGANYGGVFRFNDMFAVGYNYAQSFRISVGQGAQTFNVGELQSIPVGEGRDLSARLTLLKGKLELNFTNYDNFTPNARFTPGITTPVRDELSPIFPTTFDTTGTADYQTTKTKGNEVQILSNPTRNIRLSFSYATNKVINTERAPLLKEFQAAAKALGKRTPLLDDFLLTIPEGLPNPGYTKARGNFFGRYQFSEGALKGVSIGAGGNYRLSTYRGTVSLSGLAGATTTDLYTAPYTLYTMSVGYSRKILNRQTTFNLNVNNLTNKETYSSAALGSGSWGDPRSFRLTMTTDL